MNWLDLFLTASAALGGLLIGGFMRAQKEVHLLDVGFDRGYKAGVNEERTRARKAIYEAWEDGYEKGCAVGVDIGKGVEA
jgi:hypothetical protein